MEFLPVSSVSINRAAEVLRSGGIIAFPTETVYGLGADACNSAALARVFEAKGRPRFDPLIIHIAGEKTLEEAADLSLLTEETRRKLFLLTANFWPGPLSIILPKSEKIPAIATSGLSTAAFRFPAHEAAQSLISLAGGIVAAPSANPFGSLSPTRAEHVRDTLGEKVDIILDGGAAQIGIESTVLDITNNSVKILRHGGVSMESIEDLIGSVQDACFASENTAQGLASPGQLKSHYAPKTPLFALDTREIINRPFEEGTAWLFFDDISRNAWQNAQVGNSNPAAVRVLSASGQVRQAAACLFETLHELDNMGFSRIFTQFAPQEGLGAAINDRLTRAQYSCK